MCWMSIAFMRSAEAPDSERTRGKLHRPSPARTDRAAPSSRTLLLLLQTLKQLERGIAVRGQARAALVTTNAVARGGAHHAVRRAARKAALVQRRLQREQLA